MNSEPDGEAASKLMNTLCNRDEQALAAIYDCYAPSVYSLFLRTTRNPAEAEDLVLELFLCVRNRARQFDSTQGTLRSWVLSIARNMAIDQLRCGAAQFPKKLGSVTRSGTLQPSHTVRRPSADHKHALSFKTALITPKAHLQRAMAVSYFDSSTQPAVAGLLQQLLGTAKTWVRSALIHLRSVNDRRTLNVTSQEKGPNGDARVVQRVRRLVSAPPRGCRHLPRAESMIEHAGSERMRLMIPSQSDLRAQTQQNRLEFLQTDLTLCFTFADLANTELQTMQDRDAAIRVQAKAEKGFSSIAGLMTGLDDSPAKDSIQQGLIELRDRLDSLQQQIHPL